MSNSDKDKDKQIIEEHRQKLAELRKSTQATISRVQEAVVRAEQISQRIRQENEDKKKKK